LNYVINNILEIDFSGMFPRHARIGWTFVRRSYGSGKRKPIGFLHFHTLEANVDHHEENIPLVY